MNTLTFKGSKAFIESVFGRIPDYANRFTLIGRFWIVTGFIMEYEDKKVKEIVVVLTERVL